MAEEKRSPREMQIVVDVLIPQRESNFFTQVPKDGQRWADNLREHVVNEGYLRLRVNNFPTGCGGVGVSILTHDKDEEQELQMIMEKATLAQLIYALKLAHDNYIE